MTLFKLKQTDQNSDQAELVVANPASLELEKHLETWLENSPWAIASEPLLLIGRQTSATVDDGTFFPDLLALDQDGNLVIIELKKAKAPREVTAQILEYAAWANELTEDAIIGIAANYLKAAPDHALQDLTVAFIERFGAESMPGLKTRLRLFIAAETIPPSVARVCRFLRTEHNVDITCVSFSVFTTEAGETLVSSEILVGHEDTSVLKSTTTRWSGDKPVKQVVWEAVLDATTEDHSRVFSPREVAEIVLKKHPGFNRSTVGCQLISDCVNHTSRHHYPGGEDRYWWVEKGKYRRYDKKLDVA